MASNNSQRPWGILGFAVLILVPSFDTFFKYFGIGGVLVFSLIGIASIFGLVRFAIPVARRVLSERSAFLLAIFTLVLVTVAAATIYPLANSGRFGGGSDPDDALILAATDLLQGKFPYYQHTYLNNPISPLPGSLLFALPFVITGTIYLQNVVWLAVIYWVSLRYRHSNVFALGLVWLLLTSATVWQNIVSGADYVANSIYVAVLTWWFAAEIWDKNSAPWRRTVAAVLLGLSFSSRANFLLVVPLLLSLLFQNSGVRSWLKYFALSGLTCIAITAPFALYDPVYFSPLTSQSSKVRTLETVLPFAGMIIPLSAMMLSGLLAFQKMDTDCRVFFRNCAVVQFFTLLFTSVLYSVHAGHLDLFLGQSGYGMFTFVFAVIAAWMSWFGDEIRAPQLI